MTRIDLFEDEDGIIWYDNQGESREVGSYSAYSYYEDRMYTTAEVISEAIAESTDAGQGTYSIYDDGGHRIHSGTFTQLRDGVHLYPESEDE